MDGLIKNGVCLKMNRKTIHNEGKEREPINHFSLHLINCSRINLKNASITNCMHLNEIRSVQSNPGLKSKLIRIFGFIYDGESLQALLSRFLPL